MIPVSKLVMGTYGYAAPEIMRAGNISCSQSLSVQSPCDMLSDIILLLIDEEDFTQRVMSIVLELFWLRC